MDEVFKKKQQQQQHACDLQEFFNEILFLIILNMRPFFQISINHSSLTSYNNVFFFFLNDTWPR